MGNSKYATYRNVHSNPELNLSTVEPVLIREGEKQNSLKYGDVIFTGSSESREEVGLSSAVTGDVDEDVYLNSFCLGFRPRDLDMLHPRYSKHLFRSAFMRKQIMKTANGVTRINISKKRFKEIMVPVRSIEDQKRIADALDSLYALVNDISIGLPAEIAARRKQYEYYRDRLLAFEGE
ncbi:restriction endonuclease subunit S [Dermabacteraceae bacterium P13128]